MTTSTLSTLHYAFADPLDPSGAVHFRPAPISATQAVAWRARGLDVVARGPDEQANRDAAETVERAAEPPRPGGSYGILHHNPHASAGPAALPHFQQRLPPPRGHAFYETAARRAMP